jgi:formate hydrogenlyase subunit 3/multisubunit Na+/H+ antiporter MnhD subunit
MLMPVVSLAALCVVIGVYASPFLATVLRLAS